MIPNFSQVTSELYRGGAISPNDVYWLKDKYAINKIVSLDKLFGDKINQTCHKLNIEHIMIPIEMNNFRQSVMKLFHYDLKDLLLENGPTYVHCSAGKDRTGFVIALLKCKYFGISPEEAIDEAKSFGFGIGVDPYIISIFEKLIRASKPVDVNNADIVSNERSSFSDNRSSCLDEADRGSWAPYLSVTKQSPYDFVYNHINDQSQTRENYDVDPSIFSSENRNVVPMVGTYDNGAGPSVNVGGFIYDT